MAPTKSRAVWLREWISRIDGNSIYTTDGKVIFCEACQQKVINLFFKQHLMRQQAPATQFFQLNQHNSTEKHKANVERREKKTDKGKQQFFPSPSENIPDKFTHDLCNTLIATNIPFYKIENVSFKNFLENISGKNIPSRRTLGNYLEYSFEQVYCLIFYLTILTLRK